MSDIKISIIVPSYNQGPYITNVIKSVLGQSYNNWELIIEDGASTDNTVKVCSHYASLDNRIFFSSEKDDGFADAVNKGLAKATGELSVIQSSDDFFANENVFEEVSQIYLLNKHLLIIAGTTAVVNEDLELLITREKSEKYIPFENVYMLKDHFSQGATFFSSKRAMQIGMLDKSVDMVADTDFWVRLACTHPYKVNSILQTSRVWNCVIVQPNQRSTDLSKFFFGRAIMAANHIKNDELQLDKNFKLNHANSLIKQGISHFNGIDMNTSKFYDLYEKINNKKLEKLKPQKRSKRSLRDLAKTIFRKKQPEEKLKNSTQDIYLDKHGRYPHCNFRWF